MAGRYNNDERNAEIMRRLRTGESFGIVAEALGMTRNAVAGVSTRAGGLGYRPTTSRKPFPPEAVSRGERNPAAKLTEDRVREMRRLRETGATVRALAATYGVDHSLVYRVCTRQCWAHVA